MTEQESAQLTKLRARRTALQLNQLIEIQRKMLQGLDDIRVLLCNQYSKEYFLASLRQASEESSDAVSLESMTKFFQVLINQIVSAEAHGDESAAANSEATK